MRDAREKIVFLVTVLIMAALAYASVSDAYVRTRAPAPRAAEAAPLANPPAVRLGGLVAELSGDRGRPSFSPPRELLPMDPLALADPSPPRLSVRRPSVRGTGQGVAGSAQRVPAGSLGMLLLSGSAADEDVKAGGFGFEAMGSGGSGGARDPTDTAGSPDADSSEPSTDPEELYDWVARLSATRRYFGRILNEDVHGLRARSGEALLFQDVSLRTGATVGVAYPIDRTDVADFGLARTFRNKYLAKSRSLPSGSGAVRARMALATEMMESASFEPRALEFAEREARLAAAGAGWDPVAARLLARICAARHDPEGELSVYREAVDAEHVSDALLCDYGRFVRRLGLRERALELLHLARGLRPVSAEVRTLDGLLLLDAGRVDEALAAFRAAGQVPYGPPFEEQQQTDLVLLTGRAQLLAGRPADALRSAERILLSAADDSHALRLAGAAQVELGKLDEASRMFGQALATQPADGALLTDAAIVAWRMGDGPGAVRWLQRAMDRDPLGAAEAMIVLGFLYEDAADPERARELYADALQLSPGHPGALYRLGRQQRLQGDAEAASATLRHALRLGPPDLALLAELGRTSMDRDQPSLAARYFREGLRLLPDDAELLWLLGLAQLAEGDVVSATDTLEEAVAHGAPGAHAGLGVAHHRRGDAQQALVHFEQVGRAFAGRSEEPVAVYAAQQVAAISDNLAKRQWVDRFGRSSLQRGWSEQSWDGSPRVYLSDEVVHIEGRVERPRDDELPGIARSIDGRGFVSVQAELESIEAGVARYGVAMTYRQVKGQRGRLPKARLEIFVDGAGQVRLTVLDNFETLVLDAEPVEGLLVPVGDPVRLGIERVDAVAGLFRFLVDGRFVSEPLRVKSLRGFKNLLDLEVFADASPGQHVDVDVRAVRIVRFP